MTSRLFLVFCSLALFVTVGGQNVQFLSSQTVNQLLNDAKYVQRQLQCVLGRAKCDDVGNQLRLAIPEVLGRNCRACSPEQASNARKVVNFIKSRYPTEFTQIQSKYVRKRG